MQTTANLGLKKPETSEYVKISDINYNADIIDTEVSAKVSSSGGDISETAVNTLEPIEDKFPIPSAGERTKTFLGKILTFLRNIKPLEADVTYYVATTGSDATGDGTQGNPFKTVQGAVDLLPKDLNGYMATIVVASGTYQENVKIHGFTGGYLRINSSTSTIISDSCKVTLFDVRYCACQVIISGFSGTSVDTTPFVSLNNTNCRFYYCQVITNTPTVGGFYFGDSSGAVSSCKCSGRHTALRISNGRVLSDAWTADSINNIGLEAGAGGIITKNGIQPIGNNANEITTTGGIIFHQNGTQISNLITSGLSCTWGTITGGCVRQGNLTGVAMVTLEIRVSLTTNLTTNTAYSISGFPMVSGTSTDIIAVSTSHPSRTNYCYIGSTGILRFSPAVNMNVGDAIIFNTTYMTNS